MSSLHFEATAVSVLGSEGHWFTHHELQHLILQIHAGSPTYSNLFLLADHKCNTFRHSSRFQRLLFI